MLDCDGNFVSSESDHRDNIGNHLMIYFLLTLEGTLWKSLSGHGTIELDVSQEPML